MDFSDPNHNADELVFQGADELQPNEVCGLQMLDALTTWQARPRQTDPAPDAFHLDGALLFAISYDGKVSDYWPDEAANQIEEGLVRDFLFHDGICTLTDLKPHLFAVKYKVEALSDTEYLLVCPYPTEAGNVAGILVVCVNKYLARST